MGTAEGLISGFHANVNVVPNAKPVLIVKNPWELRDELGIVAVTWCCWIGFP